MLECLKKLRSVGGVLMALAALACVGERVSASPPGQPETVVVKTGMIITGTGEEIERGEIVIVDGTITLVGIGLEYPMNAEVIDARAYTVMPGMINARTTSGLPGYRFNGQRAGVVAADLLDYEGADFDAMIRSGFTTAVIYPPGTSISGTSSAFATASDEDWQRLLDKECYIRVQFSSFPNDKRALREIIGKARGEIKKRDDAKKKWDEEQAKKKAEAEKRAKEEEAKKKDGEQPEAKKDEEKAEPAKFEPPAMNPDVAPIVKLLEASDDATPAMIELFGASSLIHLEDVVRTLKDEESFEHFFCITRTGFTDLNETLDRFEAMEGVKILMPTDIASLPQTAHRFNPFGELIYRGCTVGVLPSFDNVAGYRTMLTDVAAAVQAGVPRDEAIKALTVNTATILGLDARLGSIERGKHANLVFLTADPLAAGASVAQVMVRGNIVFEAEESE